VDQLLLIFGGESTGREISELAADAYKSRFSDIYNVVGSDQKNSYKNTLTDVDLASFVNENKNIACIISMANQMLRYKCHKLIELYNFNPTSIIHPSTQIAKSARIGQGVYIAANTSISSNASIKAHSVINYNCVIGHDAVIDSNVIINPGAVIGGNVRIYERVAVGANAFILQGLTIGSDSIVDALTYVDKNIDPRGYASVRDLNTK
jgi:sugar O-acyltransferase (sialic acid O-acetyltransferase NeuD family)